MPQLSLDEGKPASPAGADFSSPAPPVSSELPSGAAPPSEQETLSHHPSPSAAEEETESCPYCGEKNPKGTSRCNYCREDLEEEDSSVRPWDRGYRPYRDVRRDSEPHRATLILTLGIVSIVTSATGLLAIVGLIVGICAWMMGQRDLKKMRSNVMDPQGFGSTQAGWICGIIGTAFGGLGSLCCIGWIVLQLAVFSAVGRPSTSTPPTVRPATPAGPQPVQKKKGKIGALPGQLQDHGHWAKAESAFTWQA
jgi:hypothetical protein